MGMTLFGNFFLFACGLFLIYGGWVTIREWIHGGEDPDEDQDQGS